LPSLTVSVAVQPFEQPAFWLSTVSVGIDEVELLNMPG
jgi:hypothetical protein